MPEIKQIKVGKSMVCGDRNDRGFDCSSAMKQKSLR